MNTFKNNNQIIQLRNKKKKKRIQTPSPNLNSALLADQ